MASDLISRAALLETLDNLEATGGHKYYRKGANNVLHDIMPQIIADATAVDAVEVVRCKDCFKRNDPSRCPMCYDEWYYDDDDGSDFIRQDNTIDDGFCNVGAKMDGGKKDG